MLLILSAAVVIGAELLLVRSFWPNLIAGTELVRNTLFVLGACILVIGELWVRYLAVSRVYDFTKRNKKNPASD
jgi:hypothetical protein